MSVGDCGEHGGDACLDVDQLGVEVFPGKGWRTNMGAKEAETSSEFNGEGGPSISMSFGLVEYLEMVSEIVVASL